MRRFYILLFLSLMSGLPLTYAVESPEYQFAKDFINGLDCRVYAQQKYVDEGLSKASTGDPVQDGIEVMKNMRLVNQQYQQAKDYLDPYLNSKSSSIRECANLASSVYGDFIDANARILKMYEQMYSDAANGKQLDMGKFTVEMSKISAVKEMLSKSLMDCSILLTYCLVSYTPDAEGKLSYLVITANERKSIFKQLKKVYGDSIAGGIQVGQSYLVASGAIIHQFLSQEYMNSDDR